MEESCPSRSRSKSRHHRNDSSSPRHVKAIVTSMLRQQSFTGQYRATQRVDCIGDYRHVIEVEKNDPLVPILINLRKRIREAFPDSWPGITLPGDLQSQTGYCFWLQEANQLFEPYHYRIADVIFKETEVSFVIKNAGRVVQPPTVREQNLYELMNTSMEMVQEQGRNFAQGVWSLLTLENAKNSATFLAALIAMFGAATMYLLEYFIKLMHETSNLLRAGMPAILKMLDIVQKCIGGIFVFLAMVWRDCMGANQRRPRYVQNRRQYLDYR